MTMTYKMMKNDMVGEIIGHRGMRIKRIQDESRCKIDFDKNVNQVQRTCSIIGTEENIADAKRMIQKIIQNEEKRFTVFRVFRFRVLRAIAPVPQ